MNAAVPPELPPAAPSLRRKAASVTAWTMVQLFGQYAFRLGSNLVTTRLLLPEAFGLVAFASIIIAAMALFTDIGISRSIVRERDGEEPHFLRVAWTVKIVRSWVVAAGVVAMAGILALLAPGLAPEGSVYADPRLPLVIALVALVPIFQGLESTARDLCARRMAIRRPTMMFLLSQLMGIATTISLALLWPTVWALVASMIAASFYLCVLTHLMLPGPRMAWVWDREIADRLWSFGKWIIVTSVLTFINRNADKMILGATLGSGVFGLYVIAQIWIEAGRNALNLLTMRVGFPAVSEVIRQRPKDLARVYRKFQNGIDILCLSGFAICLFGGQAMMDLLYNDTYRDAGHFVQLLSLAFLTARFEGFSNLLMNLGDTRATAVIAGTRALASCLLVPLASWLGGVDAAILTVTQIPALGAVYALRKLKPRLGAKQVMFDNAWLLASLVIAALVFLTLDTPPGISAPPAEPAAVSAPPAD